MSILDKVKIGNSVQVNLELSKDRLNKETINAINVSSLGKVSDFRITDGKGIGVILQLSNGQEQWFFEDEIDPIDENGNVIKKNYAKQEDSNFIFNFLDLSLNSYIGILFIITGLIVRVDLKFSIQKDLK